MPSLLRSLFGFDGTIFLLVGIIVLRIPGARAAALPPESGDSPHLCDTRRLLAAAYIAVGGLLLALAWAAPAGEAMRVAAVARALSLAVLVAVDLAQIRGGRWRNSSLWGYVGMFSTLAALYLLAAGSP